jgi:hypothetical protein
MSAMYIVVIPLLLAGIVIGLTLTWHAEAVRAQRTMLAASIGIVSAALLLMMGSFRDEVGGRLSC